ncbi:MAG TPA: FapA family protein [candidate division Zixibacteria bacterium]|nr:FapA family protein [candidate division Zixibacteria bacterium]
MTPAETPDIQNKDSVVRRKRVRVNITKDRLIATIAISQPTTGEPPVTEEEIRQAISLAGVTYGLNEDAIVEAAIGQAYGQSIEVAKGSPMVQGKHTEFEYFFQTENRFQPQEGPDGRIDYRDMGYIQNVHKGDLLVKRTLPADGISGTGVDGRPISAPRGRNIPFSPGENVEIVGGGLEMRARCDGAIIFKQGRVSVKDVMQVKDVDFNVGNLDCVGSLRITGHIHTGFEVKVGGDLEVSGNVEDAKVFCKGNILVRGGFYGGGDGVMHADGDVTIKYAQGQTITAGEHVISGGELVNCHVTAHERVMVKGRKGKIVGGEINAGKEIRATDIGSDAGTQTVLTVAYDEKLLRQYHEATHEIARLKTDAARVKEKLYDLYKLQLDKKLTPQQEEGLAKLEQFGKHVPVALEALEKKKRETEEKLLALRDARVIAVGKVYPGVKIHVGCLVKEIEEEMDGVIFSQDGTHVVTAKLSRSDRS